jgi:hypothetical protein
MLHPPTLSCIFVPAAFLAHHGWMLEGSRMVMCVTAQHLLAVGPNLVMLLVFTGTMGIARGSY